MLRSLGIVQACFHVPRFRWNAAHELGGRPLLEWVVRRVTDSIRLGGVIVLVCDTDDCACISGDVPSDVPVFRATGGDASAGSARRWKRILARASSACAATTCSSIRR